ncbi:hypothetical protein UFOVP325_24 [uncultured Caudovirales phage]|jgi:hypothetical protein|uniref:Uncharacterized protein n=1 Tax=uncultured Caudovirales phage TaxID=2100421 RepID=A0A6J5MQE0_9CAUD|nr:hypothetical protein UFOVP325_24 [uncultured Caudovirales phage]CAB4147280.1 hypothetical protein UFOVP430_19 [uncultured Caudovirales phage]
MITIELITEMASTIATDEGITLPTDFDADLILRELTTASFGLSNDWDFIHAQGEALVVSIHQQLGL